MANAKPYYTTDDLIESVKRRISYPLSQNTFQYSDIVAFLNEELQLSAVPAVKMEHEEYFVYKKTVPLVDGISRYEIPDRAIGMALRDLKYSDTLGNFYDMTRIAPDDKAFFQQSNGSNQTVSKYYLEGNEIVLTPLVQAGASGVLNFFVFLRPNSLVRNDRACIIQNYLKYIQITNNANLEAGDQLIVYTGMQSPTPVENIFTAIRSSQQTVVSLDTSGVITLTNPHGLTVGSTIDATLFNVVGSTSTPPVNGYEYTLTVTGTNTLKLPSSVVVTVAGTGGNIVYPFQYLIGATATESAFNLNVAINAAGISNVTSLVDATNDYQVNVSYMEIAAGFQAIKGVGNSLPVAFTIDNTTIYINFNQLPNLYTDPETDIQTTLYSPNCLVDFLQTNPGHRTYTYDVTLLSINGNVGQFDINELKTYLNNSSGGQLEYYNIKIGDYICLQNECIIPQIPPELHNALAERAASRVLMAIGDVQGYQISQAKLAEMNKMQETLIGSRVESSVTKVFNRYSLLRLGKSRFRRRY
jgi:hypothetical protein